MLSLCVTSSGLLVAPAAYAGRSAVAFAGAQRSGSVLALSGEDTKGLYAVGFNVGNQLAELSVLDEDGVDALISGIRDRLVGNEPKESLPEYVPKGAELVQAAQTARAEKLAAAGVAALKAAASEPGAVQTASGLVVQELIAGEGDSPTAADKVKCHYEGTLVDGTIFDSSYARGEPIEFGLGQVIKGWTEGLQLMKKGGKAKLTIPPDIAYGPAGSHRSSATPPPTIHYGHTAAHYGYSAPVPTRARAAAHSARAATPPLQRPHPLALGRLGPPWASLGRPLGLGAGRRGVVAQPPPSLPPPLLPPLLPEAALVLLCTYCVPTLCPLCTYHALSALAPCVPRAYCVLSAPHTGLRPSPPRRRWSSWWSCSTSRGRAPSTSWPRAKSEAARQAQARRAATAAVATVAATHTAA